MHFYNGKLTRNYNFADTGGMMFTVSDNKTIKQQARQLMRQSRPRPVLVTLLLLLILLVFAFLRAKLSGVFDPVLLEPLKEYYQAAIDGDIDHAMEIYQQWMETSSAIQQPFFHQVITFAISIVSYVLTAGYVIFIINSVRKNDPTVYNLLDGFGQFLRVTILSLIRSITPRTDDSRKLSEFIFITSL